MNNKIVSNELPLITDFNNKIVSNELPLITDFTKPDKSGILPHNNNTSFSLCQDDGFCFTNAINGNCNNLNILNNCSNVIINNSNNIDSIVKTFNELDNRFTPKRKDCILLSDSYKRLGLIKRSNLVLNCGTVLDFKYSLSRNGVSDARLHSANFCKDRLCPMCSWRRTLKTFGQVSKIIDFIKSDYNFIFLTLTIPNCSADNLDLTIDKLMLAWNKFSRLKKFKNAFDGYFRVLEITRNLKNGTYHPHFHIILAVSHDYFDRNNPHYLKHSDLLDMWRSSFGDINIKIIDVRTIRPGINSDDISGAVAEVSKYTVKSIDYLFSNNSDLTDKIVSELQPAIFGRRLVQFGGIFRIVAKDLKLDDPVDGDLVNTSQSLDPIVTAFIIRYKWNVGFASYEIVSVLESEVIK